MALVNLDIFHVTQIRGIIKVLSLLPFIRLQKCIEYVVYSKIVKHITSGDLLCILDKACLHEV